MSDVKPSAPATGAAAATDPATPPSRWRQRVQVGLIVVTALLIVAGTTAWMLWKSVPDYVQRNRAYLQGTDNVELLHQAENLERRILQALSDPGVSATQPAGPIKLTFREINAWLAVKLEAWLANQEMALPAGVSELMVDRHGERLVLAFRLRTPEVDQIVSGDFEVRVQDAQNLRVKLGQVRGGRLPLPARYLAQHLRKQSDANQKNPLVAWIDRLHAGVALDPAELGGAGRRIQVRTLRLLEDGIEVEIAPRPR